MNDANIDQRWQQIKDHLNKSKNTNKGMFFRLIYILDLGFTKKGLCVALDRYILENEYLMMFGRIEK